MHKYSSSIGNDLIIRHSSLSHIRNSSTYSKRKDASLADIFGKTFSSSNIKTQDAPKSEAKESQVTYDMMDFSEKPDLSNINTFFKNELHHRLKIDKLESSLETMKSNAIYRQLGDSFDKKEMQFCKRVLSTLKGTEFQTSNADFDVHLDDLCLQHKLTETETMIRDKLRQMSDYKKDIELKHKENKVREMWLKHTKEGASAKFGEIILKNKKIFQVENIMLLKKRIEKDQTVGVPILKSSVTFQDGVNRLSSTDRFEKSELVWSTHSAKL
jgi:hypothetical protein